METKGSVTTNPPETPVVEEKKAAGGTRREDDRMKSEQNGIFSRKSDKNAERKR